MLLFSTFFIIVGLAELLLLLKSCTKKDVIIYCVLMTAVFCFAWFYFSNPFRKSFIALILNK